MKTIILCGGYGTRLAEETKVRPKPMVKVGTKPILKHIMNIYEFYNYKKFILALGYKSKYIRDFFKNSRSKNIEMVDTGKNTKTGGRLLRLKNFFNHNEDFMLTYGDGLTNLNIKNLVKFHKSHGKIATLTSVRPPARFGELNLDGSTVTTFEEKPQVSRGWINGGFFVFNSKIFDFINGDQTMLEKEPLQKLSKLGELMAFRHEGFWQCMDTMRDKNLLNRLLREKKAPWLK